MSKRLPEPTEGHCDKYYAGMLCRSAAWSVSAFADHLLIYECSYDENGTRRQDIEIYYSFVGKVDLPE